MSQKQLAARIKTSQPRVVKIEQAAVDVSLDQMLRAFAAAGGRIVVKQVGPPRATKGPGGPAGKGRKKSKTAEDPPAAEVQIELIGTES